MGTQRLNDVLLASVRRDIISSTSTGRHVPDGMASLHVREMIPETLAFHSGHTFC